MARILIVDDDPAILEILHAYLSNEGYEVLQAADGAQARELLPRAELAVLDWMLPGVNGLDLAREARSAGLDLPLLMLTARGEEEDKLRSLDLGVDDYVVKPFSPREVVARVRALLRRAGVRHEIRSGELELNLRTRRATLNGQNLELSKLEYDLLGTFAQHPGLVWTRERLLERVWGHDFPSTARVVDVHVTGLRRKLGDGAVAPRFIETVRCAGWATALWKLRRAVRAAETLYPPVPLPPADDLHCAGRGAADQRNASLGLHPPSRRADDDAN